MGYASQQGRARISSSSPEAAGVCDRCGFIFPFSQLRWQWDWAGAQMQNKRILVCTGNNCLDQPQEQLRAIVLPPDPQPIINARPPLYAESESDYMTQVTGSSIDPSTGIPVPSTTTMATVLGQMMNKQPLGPTSNRRSNLGLDMGAQMPLVDAIKWGQPIPFLSVMANGTDTIAVSCSAAHGLSTGAQMAVMGLSDPEANGFFNITVTSGTAFTYASNRPIVAGPLLTSNVQMVTANAGVPWNFNGQIPQDGI